MLERKRAFFCPGCGAKCWIRERYKGNETETEIRCGCGYRGPAQKSKPKIKRED